MENKQFIYNSVRAHYSSAAKASGAEDGTDNKAESHERYGRKVAAAFGYSEDELAAIPSDANLGLSCGNPMALAKLREGETVIDLGSGAGFDAFLAARNVGATGKVIGVDMNPDMLERANKNKARSPHAENVSFVQSLLTDIQLPDGTADCVISNCVVNLVPEEDKQAAFNEMGRVLKPGGRVALSDILLRKELTPELKKSLALYVGCVAGASRVDSYEKYLQQAGFSDILIVDTNSDLNIYVTAKDDADSGPCSGTQGLKASSSSCCAPKDSSSSGGGGGGKAPDFIDQIKSEFKGVDFNEWAGSFKIYAVKP